ncbi:MAG: hypothetical protein H0W20_13065 [Chthoniobacterales bacterium]|nr:hypothetical protein [Chthoniobacterales bacterium]
MKLLFDADVLLNVALDRAAFADESTEAIERCQKVPRSLILAWQTVSNVYYVLRAARSDAKARTFISDMLRFAVVVSGGTEAVNRALSLPMNDFEDALQVAAAMSVDADFIVTRNVRDYRGSPVPIRTPHQFLMEERKS